MSNDYPTSIDLCDGKYTLIYDLQVGKSECLRYGEPWRQLVGDKMVLACFDEIVGLRQQRDELLAKVEMLERELTATQHVVAQFSEGERKLRDRLVDAENFLRIVASTRCATPDLQTGARNYFRKWSVKE